MARHLLKEKKNKTKKPEQQAPNLGNQEKTENSYISKKELP